MQEGRRRPSWHRRLHRTVQGAALTCGHTLVAAGDGLVGACAKGAREEHHAQYREDDMKDENDRHYVGDAGQCAYERGDDELHARVALEQAERAEDTQDAQRLELTKGGDGICQKTQ